LAPAGDPRRGRVLDAALGLTAMAVKPRGRIFPTCPIRLSGAMMGLAIGLANPFENRSARWHMSSAATLTRFRLFCCGHSAEC
jgi:hypothetical protein